MGQYACVSAGPPKKSGEGGAARAADLRRPAPALVVEHPRLETCGILLGRKLGGVEPATAVRRGYRPVVALAVAPAGVEPLVLADHLVVVVTLVALLDLLLDLRRI